MLNANFQSPPPIMQTAIEALMQAKLRIEKGRTVLSCLDGAGLSALDRRGNPFLEFNQNGLVFEGDESLPRTTFREAIDVWEGCLSRSLDSADVIEWRVVPQISREGDKWGVYSRLSFWKAEEPAAPPPYLPAAAEEAQAAVRFLRARLQEAEAGNIVGLGLVVVRPGNPLVDVCMLGIAGHRHALVSGTVSLLHELNEAGKVPKQGNRK